MRQTVLLDTGPLVALLSARDRYHAWSREQLGRFQAPLLTCEAVIAEACFLVRGLRNGQATVMQLLEQGLLRVPFRLESELGPIARLLRRYADVPMSLADACLVRMSEQHDRAVVLTLDADFAIYRRHGRQVVEAIRPK